MNRPTILSIAGSDSGGGAGIQIDCKTAERIGCFSTTVITALTAQNLEAVREVMPVPAKFIEAQFRAVVEGFRVDAVKIGMVGSAENVALIAKLIKEYSLKNIVIDPVLVATSGGNLGGKGVVDAILEHFLPIATLLTPNQDEAEILCGMAKGSISSLATSQNVWAHLRDTYGLNALLLKGGHATSWQGSGVITDRLFQGDDFEDITAQRLDVIERLTHGTGCTLSSAVASYLALGNTLSESCHKGVQYVQDRLKARMK